MTITDDAKLCGRCGAYRRAHPTRACVKPRPSFWWDRHHPVRHMAGVAWLSLPQRWRWAYVFRLRARRPDLCWCALVDAAMLDDSKADYRAPWGCGCDVPMPLAREVGTPSDDCYCEAPDVN